MSCCDEAPAQATSQIQEDLIVDISDRCQINPQVLRDALRRQYLSTQLRGPMNRIVAAAGLSLTLLGTSALRAQTEEAPTHAECTEYRWSRYDDCRSGRMRDKARAAAAKRADLARQVEAMERAEYSALRTSLGRMSPQEAFLLGGKLERENKVARAIQVYEHLVDRSKSGEWAVRANERLLKLSGR